jgi:hypothetical protein
MIDIQLVASNQSNMYRMQEVSKINEGNKCDITN